MTKEPKLTRGTQIAYVPYHVMPEQTTDLATALRHPDTEFGFVTSGPTAEGDYFCRYWLKGRLGDLRTKSCSELTPHDRLVVTESVLPQIVTDALALYC